MLTKFDWLRRCRTGAELLATLRYFSENRDISFIDVRQGSPFSAFGKLCLRCKVYAPASRYRRGRKHYRYCKFCRNILLGAREFTSKSPYSIVIWGYVNRVPQQLREYKLPKYVHGLYVHDEQRFLMSLRRWCLRQWFQELVLYYGSDLKGLIQIFPTLGEYRNLNMGDYITWAIHHEASLSMAQLRVRFFTSPQQLINPKGQDQKGILTFNVSEFLRMLEIAEIFRANLRPEEQKNLYELLNLGDTKEEQFYWGRFLGQLNQEAKDMLGAWKIRQWPKNQLNLLYTLIDYVILPQSS